MREFFFDVTTIGLESEELFLGPHPVRRVGPAGDHRQSGLDADLPAGIVELGDQVGEVAEVNTTGSVFGEDLADAGRRQPRLESRKRAWRP